MPVAQCPEQQARLTASLPTHLAPTRKIAAVPARQSQATQDHSQPPAQNQILDNNQARLTPEQAAIALVVQAAFPLEPIVGQSRCREQEVAPQAGQAAK